MFCLMQKLAAQIKAEKSRKVNQLLQDLGHIQSQLQASPNNIILFAAERRLKEQLLIWNVQAEYALKQKSHDMRVFS